ncbi:hypothetical protein [Nannocystis pusilla]|uniref:hypothetical protein n=1 Tax=Nannocystis pusilla TaxID=889268 RepID=UPI003B76E72D
MSLPRVTSCVCLLALLAACTNSGGADDGTGTSTTGDTGGPESTGTTDAPTGTTWDTTATEPPTGTSDVSTTGPDEPPPAPEAFPVLQDIVFTTATPPPSTSRSPKASSATATRWWPPASPRRCRPRCRPP